MGGRSNRLPVVAMALIAYAAVPAGAQPGAPQAAPGTAPGAAADAQIKFQARPKLSPREQLEEGDRIFARITLASTAVRRQLEQARGQRDVVRILCLNDKLSQIDVAVRSARERRGALQQAERRNDADLSTHEFTVLTVLRQRTEQLGAEANQCIGEEAAVVGDSRVTVTINPTDVVPPEVALPTPLPEPVPDTVPPPQVSGFR